MECFLNGKTVDDLMKTVQDNITGFGIHLTGVMSNPPLTYTTGLFPSHGFEILASGLLPHHSAPIFNDIYETIKDSTLRMNTPDDRFTNLPVVFKYCGVKAQEINGVSRTFYKKDCILMVQMVMCDAGGRFPWDNGFDHAYMEPRQINYWE